MNLNEIRERWERQDQGEPSILFHDTSGARPHLSIDARDLLLVVLSYEQKYSRIMSGQYAGQIDNVLAHIEWARKILRNVVFRTAEIAEAYDEFVAVLDEDQSKFEHIKKYGMSAYAVSAHRNLNRNRGQ